MDIFKILASFGGIGYIKKGSGTVAAALWCAIWFLVQLNGIFYPFQFISVALFLLFGIWSANKVEADWGIDSNRVVIDEVLGMSLTLLLVPVRWQYVIVGFVFFRFFDIVKPLYIRRLEKMPQGWGVMADDALAGVYSWIGLQVVIHSHIWIG